MGFDLDWILCGPFVDLGCCLHVAGENPSWLGTENTSLEDTGSFHQGLGMVGGVSTQPPSPVGLCLTQLWQKPWSLKYSAAYSGKGMIHRVWKLLVSIPSRPHIYVILESFPMSSSFDVIFKTRLGGRQGLLTPVYR